MLKDASGNILHLPIDWDQEPGYLPTSPKGDGYSVHDEYRGFHYVTDDGKTAKWTDTDPLNKIDVFFWDQTNRYTQPLRSILAAQGTDDERANGSFKFVYRRVNSGQAHAFTRNKPLNGADVLNANSITRGRQKQGYAVVYAEDLTTSQPGGGGTAADYSLVLGRTPSFHSDGTPIFILPLNIGKFLATPGNGGFPASTLTAEVVAHETGHHFGQFHPERPGCQVTGMPHCSFLSLADKTQLPNLTSTQFGFVGVKPDGQNKLKSDTLYIRLNQYLFTGSGQMHDADCLLVGGEIVLDGKGHSKNVPSLAIVQKTVEVPDPSGNNPVFKVRLSTQMESTAGVRSGEPTSAADELGTVLELDRSGSMAL